MKDKFQDPTGYLEAHITSYQKLIKDYQAEHLREPLGLTHELVTYFKASNEEAIKAFYLAHGKIGEGLGSAFYTILSFLKEYLAQRK